MKKTRKTKKQGGAAPPTDAHDDAVERGRQAWKSLKETGRTSWEKWKIVGEALMIGRTHAMEVAKTNKPNGSRYSEAFNVWMMERDFDDIDGSDRAKLLSIMGDLDKYEKWRERLTEGQRAAWNAPSTVWKIARCKDRGIEAMNEKAEAPIPNPKDLPPAAEEKDIEEDFEDDEQEEQVEGRTEDAVQRWQRGLDLRARKAIGDAKLSRWRLPEPPTQGLIWAVEQAVQAWEETLNYLKSIQETPSANLADAPHQEVERVLEGAD
jgi:hypothetical protein